MRQLVLLSFILLLVMTCVANPSAPAACWWQGYDSVIRATLIVHVYERSLRCVCRDGRVMTLSFEPQVRKTRGSDKWDRKYYLSDEIKG